MEKINAHMGNLEEVRTALAAMFEEDQDECRRLTGQRGPAVSDAIAMRKWRTLQLQRIIDEYGWPTISLFGAESAAHAWLLAQHSDHDPTFQGECLRLLLEAPEGEVLPRHVALLTDRVLMNFGHPQRYGSQFYTDAAGVFGPYPIEDVAHLDERRVEVGLEPFEAYRARMLERYVPVPPV